MVSDRNEKAHGRAVSIFVRLFESPPGKAASQLERDRWTRAFGLKLVIPTLPILVVLLIVVGETWAYVAFGVWLAVWLGSLARLSADIRRAR